MRAARLILAAYLIFTLLTIFTFQATGRKGFDPLTVGETLHSVTAIAACLGLLWGRIRLGFVLAGVALLLGMFGYSQGAEIMVLLTGALAAVLVLRPLHAFGTLVALVAASFVSVLPSPPVDRGLYLVLYLAFLAAGTAAGVLVRVVLVWNRRRMAAVGRARQRVREVRESERMRLADDLQAVIVAALRGAREQLPAPSDRGADTAALRSRLTSIEDAMRDGLLQLRSLVVVLREPTPEDQPASIHRRRVLGRALPVLAVVVLAGALVAITTTTGDGAQNLAVFLTISLCVLTAARADANRWMALVLLLTAHVAATHLLTGWDAAVIRMVSLLNGVVLGLGAGLLLRNATDNGRAASSALRAVGHEMAQAMEQDRAGVARELHDVVASQLSLTSMEVLATSVTDDPVAMQEGLRRISDHVERAEQELDLLLHALRGPAAVGMEPEVLVSPGVVLDHSVELLGKHGFRPELRGDLAALSGLDVVTQRTLSRAVQETTTNIMRYALPDQPCVFEVDVQPDDILLRVTNACPDVGARTSDLSTGFGLLGLQERVLLCRGQMTAERRGSQWTVEIHLPHNPRVESVGTPRGASVGAPPVEPIETARVEPVETSPVDTQVEPVET